MGVAETDSTFHHDRERMERGKVRNSEFSFRNAVGGEGGFVRHKPKQR